MTRHDLIIRGGTAMIADGPARVDIAVDGGAISDIAPEVTEPANEEVDAAGLHIFPGTVDAHVHFNEPGRTEWEGWATGSGASAVGGTTTVCEMPLNSCPPTLDGAAFDAKRAAAEASSVVDFALWGGLTPRNRDDLDELAARGVVGFKAFMSNSGIEEFPLADDPTLLAGMKRAAVLGLPVAVHAENDSITATLARRATAAGLTAARDYLASRPAIAEVEAIGRAILFAEETGCTLHVVHVSTSRGVSLIAAARARGVDVSAETCPHYLLFDDADLERLGAVAKCAPPLRPRAECEALWAAIARGDIQTLASDHSPAPPELKSGNDFFGVWGGISGCQSLTTATISEGHLARGLPLGLVANLTASAPATRFRLPRKGQIAIGYDADLALVDLAAPHQLAARDLRYRHQHSPFVGAWFGARVCRTLVRGRTVAADGDALERGGGRLVTPSNAIGSRR